MNWNFTWWTLFVFVAMTLDMIFRKRVLRKLDWFLYERPVLKRLERERLVEEERERKKIVVCIHEGPYR